MGDERVIYLEKEITELKEMIKELKFMLSELNKRQEQSLVNKMMIERLDKDMSTVQKQLWAVWVAIL